MNEVTRVLLAAEQGDPHAAAELLPFVYDELRNLAAAKLAHENPGQTLDAIALVHEASAPVPPGPDIQGLAGAGAAIGQTRGVLPSDRGDAPLCLRSNSPGRAA